MDISILKNMIVYVNINLTANAISNTGENDETHDCWIETKMKQE